MWGNIKVDNKDSKKSTLGPGIKITMHREQTCKYGNYMEHKLCKLTDTVRQYGSYYVYYIFFTWLHVSDYRIFGKKKDGSILIHSSASFVSLTATSSKMEPTICQKWLTFYCQKAPNFV